MQCWEIANEQLYLTLGCLALPQVLYSYLQMDFGQRGYLFTLWGYEPEVKYSNVCVLVVQKDWTSCLQGPSISDLGHYLPVGPGPLTLLKDMGHLFQTQKSPFHSTVESKLELLVYLNFHLLKYIKKNLCVTHVTLYCKKNLLLSQERG